MPLVSPRRRRPQLRSCLCTERSMTSPAVTAWLERLRPVWDPEGTGEPCYLHRKLWEFGWIAACLDERGMLRRGRRGLGFGVGTDPLAALFAARGAEVLATDLAFDDAVAGGWNHSGQHARDFAELNSFGLCDRRAFAQRVSFREVDMNHIPGDLATEGFDFTWSACALEHLGSIDKGLAFVGEQMRCLRPGGVAVHTTEFNVTSETDTVDDSVTVLFRRSDITGLVARLRAEGHEVDDVDFDPGDSVADGHVDTPPYYRPHLKIQVGDFVTTSLGLVVRKGGRQGH